MSSAFSVIPVVDDCPHQMTKLWQSTLHSKHIGIGGAGPDLERNVAEIIFQHNSLVATHLSNQHFDRAEVPATRDAVLGMRVGDVSHAIVVDISLELVAELSEHPIDIQNVVIVAH